MPEPVVGCNLGATATRLLCIHTDQGNARLDDTFWDMKNAPPAWATIHQIQSSVLSVLKHALQTLWKVLAGWRAGSPTLLIITILPKSDTWVSYTPQCIHNPQLMPIMASSHPYLLIIHKVGTQGAKKVRACCQKKWRPCRWVLGYVMCIEHLYWGNLLITKLKWSFLLHRDFQSPSISTWSKMSESAKTRRVIICTSPHLITTSAPNATASFQTPCRPLRASIHDMAFPAASTVRAPQDLFLPCPGHRMLS